MTALADIDIIVLAGGLGTRLAPVIGDTPKFLAPFNGGLFADVFMRELEFQGVRRAIFALAHGGAAISEWLATHQGGIDVISVIEREPTGTAGAVRAAYQYTSSDPVLVMNGDTLIDADLDLFVNRGLAGTVSSLYSLYSLVDGKPVCAGVHLFGRDQLWQCLGRDEPSFAQLVNDLSYRWSYVSRWHFWDIGTPEGLEAAKESRR